LMVSTCSPPQRERERVKYGLDDDFVDLVLIQFLHIMLTISQSVTVELECQACTPSWGSVWQAHTTLTQLMLANGSWGQVHNPVIRHSLLTLLFFVAMLLSAQLLILNSILAEIVEHAQAMHEWYKEVEKQNA